MDVKIKTDQMAPKILKGTRISQVKGQNFGYWGIPTPGLNMK